MNIVFYRFSSKFIIVCLLCGLALPTQAAFLSDLSKSLLSLQNALNDLRVTLLGQVTPAPLTAGVGTVITVTTALQLTSAIANATGGETIMLAPGNYGAVFIRNKAYTAPVTITSSNASDPAVIASLSISQSKNVTLSNIISQYVYKGEPIYHRNNEITGSSNIMITDVQFIGANDTAGYGSGYGVVIAGNSNTVTLKNSTMTKWGRALVAYESQNLNIIGNTASDISNDVMNFVMVEDLLLENNYLHSMRRDPNSGNHADVVQFFTSGTIVPTKNVIIRGNVFDIASGSWAQSLFMGNEEVRLGRAGIEMFYQNVLIENNVIRNLHVHGITVGETIGLTIRNNKIITAPLTTVDPETAKYIETYGQTASIYVPRIFASPISKIVQISDNIFYGGEYHTGQRLEGYTTQSDWTVNNNVIKLNEQPVVTPPGGTLPPTTLALNLNTSTSSVTTGSSALLTWSSQGASTCTASGDWSGLKSTSGSVTTGMLGTARAYTFTLACMGTDGSEVRKSTYVTATAPVVTSIDIDSDGVADAVDNCPSVANSTQLDKDADGTGDMCDSTPDGVIPTPIPVVTSIYPTGATVATNPDRLNVRSVPGAQVVGKQMFGARGVITNQQPVLSKGYIWVYVDFTSGVDGWVADSYLKLTL